MVLQLRFVDNVGQDFRLAFRNLLHRPGFTAAAIATFALGIGASTAIFSVAYGVSMRSLPYPEPDRLIRIYEANAANGRLKQDVSEGAFHAWRGGVASIESAALYGRPVRRFLVAFDQQPLTTNRVSPGFFDVLGIRPILGPGFKSEKEYTRYTAADEVVVSHAAWQRLFGGRGDVVGKLLEFSGVGDNDVARIVGVMPEGFAFGESVDVWWPSQIVELPIRPSLRSQRDERVIARLRPGATVQQAATELEVVASRLAGEFPTIHGGWTVTVESLRDSVIGDFGRATWLLLSTVAVVLLVACLNVGGLLVARAVARERETAVRTALGAGSWHLVRLWFAEASVLAVFGTALGLFLAWSGVLALKIAAPPGIPRLESIMVDLPTLVIAVFSGVIGIAVFTLASHRPERSQRLVDSLRGGSSAAGDIPSRRTTRTALTVAQCAGAAALVVLAVLLTRSFVTLMSDDLGWEPAGVLSMSISPPIPREIRRPWYRYIEWSDRLIARLESTSRIDRAAITNRIPLTGDSVPTPLARGRGKAARDDARWTGVAHIVSDEYFPLMGIRLVNGRTFGPADRFTEEVMAGLANRPDHGVAIVSESTARTLWPGQSAIGQALWVPVLDWVSWREVIGVVEDIQFHAVGEEPTLHVFLPWTQSPTGRFALVVKGTRGQSGASIAPLVRDVVDAVEPGTRIDQVAPLDALVSRATAQPRFTSSLVVAFGALALLLASVGIYGSLSYLVGTRTREIGVRIALGARRSNIVSDVLVRGLIPAVAGGILGVAIAVALAQTFRSLLFGVEPLDLTSFAGGASLLFLVALAAALGPALRASRVNPARALRAD